MTYSQINPTKVGGFLLLTVLFLLVGCITTPCPDLKEEGFEQAGFCTTRPEGRIFCIEFVEEGKEDGNICCLFGDDDCPDSVKNLIEEEVKPNFSQP